MILFDLQHLYVRKKLSFLDLPNMANGIGKYGNVIFGQLLYIEILTEIQEIICASLHNTQNYT